MMRKIIPHSCLTVNGSTEDAEASNNSPDISFHYKMRHFNFSCFKLRHFTRKLTIADLAFSFASSLNESVSALCPRFTG